MKNIGKNGPFWLPIRQNTYSVELPKIDPKANEKRKKSHRNPNPTCFTLLEKERFFSAIVGPRDKAIFGLMYYHGLRASEPGLLKFSDYREGDLLRFDRLNLKRGKNSISGECALIPAASQLMRAWIRVRGTKDGPLFPSRNRRPISRFMIFRLMQRYCEKAHIPPEKSHPHVLKHSAAVHLLAAQREGIVDVQRHLGHRDIKNTMIYLGALTEEFNEERVRRLQKWT